MATTHYSATALIGGAAGALDLVDGTALADGDFASVYADNIAYLYILDSDSAETESIPEIISPDSNAGNKRWVLQNSYSLLSKGQAIRAHFEYKDGDEIYIGAGAYHLAGATDRMVYWDAQITFQLQSGGSNAASDDYGADGWHYIYIDDSAVITAGIWELTASEFLNDTTAPSWSATKHGWYNGNDRCVFAVYETGGALLEFQHDGNYVQRADAITEMNGTDITTDWSDEVTYIVPTFVRKVNTTFSYDYGNSLETASWRTEGQSGTTGHVIGTVEGGKDEKVLLNVNAIISSNLKLDVKDSGVATNTLTVYNNGWHFPIGM